MFTVMAVLFAGLGIVATKSSESSLTAASVSLIVIAAVALYFALKPYYLISRLTKIMPTQTIGGSVDEFHQLLRLGWKEAVLVCVLILTSLGIDGWSIWSIRGRVRNVKTAQSLSTQAIQDTKAQKVELGQKIADLRATYDSKIGDLEREIENLRKTKRDK